LLTPTVVRRDLASATCGNRDKSDAVQARDAPNLAKSKATSLCLWLYMIPANDSLPVRPPLYANYAAGAVCTRACPHHSPHHLNLKSSACRAPASVPASPRSHRSPSVTRHASLTARQCQGEQENEEERESERERTGTRRNAPQLFRCSPPATRHESFASRAPPHEAMTFHAKSPPEPKVVASPKR
jgi:hypothetical protein